MKQLFLEKTIWQTVSPKNTHYKGAVSQQYINMTFGQTEFHLELIFCVKAATKISNKIVLPNNGVYTTPTDTDTILKKWKLRIQEVE